MSTYQIPLPLGTMIRQTVEFTANPDGGTHVSLRCAKPEGTSALSTAFVDPHAREEVHGRSARFEARAGTADRAGSADGPGGAQVIAGCLGCGDFGSGSCRDCPIECLTY
jgi:hypothetical protein